MGQLTMRFKGPTGYKAPELPEGWSVTTCHTEADGLGWIEACRNGQLGVDEWDYAKFKEGMLDVPGVGADHIFLLKDEKGEVMATSAAYVRKNGQATLHMVGARESCRGKKLGSIPMVAVMDWFAANGIQEIFLSTDDFRLGAIKTYLRLGFIPVLDDFGMDDRWRAIFKTLDMEPVAYKLHYEEISL